PPARSGYRRTREKSDAHRAGRPPPRTRPGSGSTIFQKGARPNALRASGRSPASTKRGGRFYIAGPGGGAIRSPRPKEPRGLRGHAWTWFFSRIILESRATIRSISDRRTVKGGMILSVASDVRLIRSPLW